MAPHYYGNIEQDKALQVCIRKQIGDKKSDNFSDISIMVSVDTITELSATDIESRLRMFHKRRGWCYSNVFFSPVCHCHSVATTKTLIRLGITGMLWLELHLDLLPDFFLL